MTFHILSIDRKFWLLSLFVFVITPPVSAIGQIQDSNKTNVERFDDFLVFPVKRVGNAIYQDRHLLHQDENQKILAVTRARHIKAIVYLYQNRELQLKIGVIDSNQSDLIQVRDAGFGVYEIQDRKTGIRRLYRIYKDQLEPLMEERRSTRDPVTSSTHTVFYHIRDTEKMKDANGKERWRYEFRLHLLRHDQSDYQTLPLKIKDWTPNLQLTWMDTSKLQIRYSDRRSETIDLQTHAPSLF